ncbi:MAG TPA: APC family permease [Candidatus Saccharimonadales bacterium]|nr:APC family permease [Candidatus Saccharimonadales bacterium]
MEKKPVFVRDATGLVREAGMLDILQFNAQSVTGVAIVAGGLLLLPLMTSGIGIAGSIILGLITAIFVNMTYYILSVTIPRSGGDYIYISRLLHPALGVLAAGLMGIFVPIILAATFGASVWVTAGLSPLLAAIGQGSLASVVTSSTNLTIAGMISTVFFALLLIFGGNRAFFRLNNILYLVAMIGLIVGGAVFLTMDHATFVHLFDTYASTYSTNSTDIITTASSNGLTMPNSGPTSVLIASALMFASFYWCTQSSYLGGEIKHIKRTQFWGMIGAGIIWGAITLFAIIPAYYTVGPTLITSADYLNYMQPALWKIPVSSFFALYANIAAQNPAVGILIAIAFLFGYLTATGWAFIIFSRVVFAMSFDRFLPTKLADINEKYGSPVNAIVFVAALTAICLILLTNSQTAVILYTWGVAINVVAMLTFIMSSVALALLPFLHKTTFEVACPFKQKIAGFPVVSLVGIVSAILLVVYEYLELSNPVFFGISPAALEAMGVTIVFFLALYFVVAAYRKSHGIDLSLVYKEIPPE